MTTFCICICHRFGGATCPICVAWHLLNGDTGTGRPELALLMHWSAR